MAEVVFDHPKGRRAGLVVRWLVRLGVLAAVACGVWWVVSRGVARQCFVAGMRELASDPAKASQHLRIAAGLQPSNGQYQAALGRALLEGQDYVGAARHLGEAAPRRPDDYGLWYDLGQACLQASRPEGARRAFEQALRLRPDSLEALSSLAEAAAKSSDWRTAATALRQLHEQNPDNLAAAAELARALAKDAQYDEALRVCQEAEQRALKAAGPRDEAGDQVLAKLVSAQADAYRGKRQWGDALRSTLALLPLLKGTADIPLWLQVIPEDLVRGVVVFPGKARGVVFSPAGDRLVFYWIGSNEGSGLFVLDSLSARPRKVVGTEEPVEAGGPAWSPDGKWICYADAATLYLVHPDGTGKRRLVRNTLQWAQLLKVKTPQVTFEGLKSTESAFPVQGPPTWSPDGKRIAYRASSRRAGSVTCVVSVATGQAHSVHSPSGSRLNCEGEYPPAWSLDGRLVCGPLSYLQRTPDGLTLWTAEGRVHKQVPVPAPPSETPGHAITRVVWSPDARYLAVALADEGGTETLVVARADGKGSKTVAREVVPGGVRWLDGQHLWFLRRSPETRLSGRPQTLVCDPGGRTTKAKRAFPLAPVGEWAVSRDGQWLAMASELLAVGGGTRGLWVVNLEKMIKAGDR